VAEKDPSWIIAEIFALVRSAGPWLNRRWAFFAPFFGVFVAVYLNYAGLIPSLPENKSGLTTQWWKLGSFVVLPTAAFVGWLVSTQLYLRSGRGAKIGLAYDGPVVNLSDWRRTKQVLKDLFAGGKIGKRVSLRFVPLRATQVKAVGQRYMERYGFMILLVIETPPSKNGQKVADNFSLGISTKTNAEPYLKASLQNALAIWAVRTRAKPPTLQDYRSTRAQNLFDLLLLFVATHYFANENYKDASTLLRVVDANLESHFRPNQPPRINIREFDVQCCTRPLYFPVSQVPDVNVLEERIVFAERAMCYFGEFAGVYTTLSRSRFLLGDVETAVSLTSRIRHEIRTLKEANLPIAKPVLVTVHLNYAFLEFIQGRWQNAHNGYMAMLGLEEHRKENWASVIEFIDYVRSFDHFEGIPFLQVLYRSIAKQSIPATLRAEAESWLAEDGSRNMLRALLKASSGHRTMRGQTKNPAKKPPRKKRR
jgi:hypothetical protein